MTRIFATLLFALPMLVFSQQSSLAKLAQFTAADSNRAHITVSGAAFSLMAEMEIDSVVDAQLKKLAKSISGMEAFAEFSKSTGNKLLQNLNNHSAFSQYASFEQKDNSVQFFVAEKNGIVTEIIVVALEQDGAYAASVVGNMDIKDVGQLYKLISDKQFQYLNSGDAK